MFKAFAVAALGGATLVSANFKSYARGTPPTTQNCNMYPVAAQQTVAWGLVVDREFGGCRCADETRQEWMPDPATHLDSTWACYCLNTDTYLNMPNVAITGTTSRDAANMNGKQCGVEAACQVAAVT